MVVAIGVDRRDLTQGDGPPYREPRPIDRARSIATSSDEAGRSVPVLAARREDLDVRVRGAATVALGQFGRGAFTAVPALLDARPDGDGIPFDDFSVSSRVARAIQASGPAAAKPMVDRRFALLGSTALPPLSRPALRSRASVRNAPDCDAPWPPRIARDAMPRVLVGIS